MKMYLRVAVLIFCCAGNAAFAENSALDPLFLSPHNAAPSWEMRALIDALTRGDYFQRLEELRAQERLELTADRAERHTIVLPSALAGDPVSYIVIRELNTSRYWIIRRGGLSDSLEIFRGVP